MLIKPGELLATIDNPADLRKLNQSQLVQLSEELRQFIIDNVSVYGGHFGASLGVVELTVALHYVFNTPNDQLVWDVGHQAYGHKILTERRNQFSYKPKIQRPFRLPKAKRKRLRCLWCRPLLHLYFCGFGHGSGL